MAKILDGKLVATKIKQELKEYVQENNLDVKLTIFQMGDNPASNIYIRNKQKACEEVGIESELVKCDTLGELKIESSVCFYPNMIQLPLPVKCDEQEVIDHIFHGFDADCLTTRNLGKLFVGDDSLAPCTAQGIIDLLEYYGIEIEGKHAVVVGRSNIVGKPVAHLLLNRNATVTVCHSRTKDLKKYTKDADILIVAIGKSKFITGDMVKEGAVVVDVGINRDENGKVCGDVDFASVEPKAGWITPVPGGVGPMTVAELVKNAVKLCEKKGKCFMKNDFGMECIL